MVTCGARLESRVDRCARQLRVRKFLLKQREFGVIAWRPFSPMGCTQHFMRPYSHCSDKRMGLLILRLALACLLDRQFHELSFIFHVRYPSNFDGWRDVR